MSSKTNQEVWSLDSEHYTPLHTNIHLFYSVIEQDKLYLINFDYFSTFYSII